MMDKYGHIAAIVTRSAMEVECHLAEILAKNPDAPLHVKGANPNDHNYPPFFVAANLAFMHDYALQLDLQAALHRCKLLITTIPVKTSLQNVYSEFQEIRRQFEFDLRDRYYLSIDPADLQYWEHKSLFGDEVNTQFADAQEDIESAGNCLALGQGTACVLHLMRAMEIAMRRLGDRLAVTIRPNHTWGGVLNEINPKIAALPDKTEQEQRTKHRWSEVRTDLWHVKEAWRDDSMHGKRTYTPQQAKEVLNTCKVLMQHLAKL